MVSPFKPSEGFKGLWVPICILIDSKLTLIQKILLAEIYQLQQNDSGECFASNAHFSALTGCKERNLRNHLSALVESGLLRSYSPTRRRRLAVAKNVKDAIESGSQEPVTGQSNPTQSTPAATKPNNAKKQQSSTLDGDTVRSEPADECRPSQRDAKRQSNAVGGGKIDSDPAEECRPFRHQSATERTERFQQKDTTKTTTVPGVFPTLKSDIADTHVRDEHGTPLASIKVWKEWLSWYRPAEGERALSLDEQREKLAEMVAEGFDGEELLKDTLDCCMPAFWSPPDWVVPEGLKRKYGYERLASCSDEQYHDLPF